MCRVTLRPLGHAAVIEVDGALDIVGGHDLRQVFAEALRSTDGTLFLDLSRVTVGDEQCTSGSGRSPSRNFSRSWCCLR